MRMPLAAVLTSIRFAPRPCAGRALLALAMLALSAGSAGAAATQGLPPEVSAAPWWVWPLALFAVTFLLGIVAVLAGVGGGVLFVPIIGGFFPFHLDFVRSAGLLLALAGSLSAGPKLLASRMASLRLAMPFALVGSVFSIVGALLSFALPVRAMQAMLGGTIMVIVVLMWRAVGSEFPRVAGDDRIAAALELAGVYFDTGAGKDVAWRVHRSALGFVAFAVIGLVGGMFGLGAGWANVPALNLLLGVPLRAAVATSNIVMSIINSSAAWIYIARGAILPILTVPSLLGVMLGANVGARMLHHIPASVIRRLVIVMLLLAATRALLKGFGVWN